MSAVPSPEAALRASLTDREIQRRIDDCPKLASLEQINTALAGLVNSDQTFNSQIADLIRHDPSLTARLLRMVNSVYFGLSAKVNNIEEAVLYLGLRQIRELSMATPVIEELEKLGAGGIRLPWSELWQHSIGTAVVTREILSTTSLLVDDDTDYIVGLLHNVGKVVMGSCFADELSQVASGNYQSLEEVCETEEALIGWDHARIGAAYLEKSGVSAEIVSAVRWHNDPEKAGPHAIYAAAVQVADRLVRHTGIRGGFENVPPVREGAWKDIAGWKILYGSATREARIAEAAIRNTLRRLPLILSGISS